MNIEKELQNIAAEKKGNTEMAFFYNDSDYEDYAKWVFFLGNPTSCVQLGEVDGEIKTLGNTLEEVVSKMKQELRKTSYYKKG